MTEKELERFQVVEKLTCDAGHQAGCHHQQHGCCHLDHHLYWYDHLCNYRHRHLKLGVIRSLGFQSSGLKSSFNELGTRGSSVGNISITLSTGATPLMEILFLDNSDGDSPFRRDFIDLRDKNGDLLCLAWVGSWHQTHPDLSSLVYF